MTIDEAIEYQRNMAEKYKYQLVLNETGHPMYSLGDREISRIERYVEEYTQVAEWLEELKIIKEYDLSIPQHFTQEQSKWIKNYCIQKNKGFYQQAIYDFANKLKEKISNNIMTQTFGLRGKDIYYLIDETIDELK